MKDAAEIGPVIYDCPLQRQLIGTDSLISASYMDIEINGNKDKAYASIQKLRDSIDLDYINIVGNIFTELTPASR